MTEEVTARSSKTTIAKHIRQKLKKEFPDCKFSVRTEYFSGGSGIDAYLMEAPFEVIAEEKYREYGYHQLSEGQLKNGFNDNLICNGVELTQKGWDLLARAVEILDELNWDNSDPQTDYFNVNYYSGLSIGRWDKKFKAVE